MNAYNLKDVTACNRNYELKSTLLWHCNKKTKNIPTQKNKNIPTQKINC